MWFIVQPAIFIILSVALLTIQRSIRAGPVDVYNAKRCDKSKEMKLMLGLRTQYSFLSRERKRLCIREGDVFIFPPYPLIDPKCLHANLRLSTPKEGI